MGRLRRINRNEQDTIDTTNTTNQSTRFNPRPKYPRSNHYHHYSNINLHPTNLNKTPTFSVPLDGVDGDACDNPQSPPPESIHTAPEMASLEDIIRQLADIRTQLGEETLRRQAAENRYAAAETRLAAIEAASAAPPATQPTTQPQVYTASPAHHGPKIASPDKFEGKRGVKAEIFISQVSLYVMTNHRMFLDERSKVAFAISYLSGEASIWATPLVNKLLEPDSDSTITYADFITAFKSAYYDPHRVTKAENELRALRQTRSVVEYSTKFNQLASIISWDQQTLLSHFRGHLKPEISVHMIRDEFKTLAEAVTIATNIDNALHPTKESAFGTASSSTPTSTANVASIIDPDAMDCSAMRFNIPTKEYQRRKDNNLCFYCGKANHSVSRCTQLKADNERAGKSKWKGKAQISEVTIRGDTVETKGEEGGSMGKGKPADVSKNGEPRE